MENILQLVSALLHSAAHPGRAFILRDTLTVACSVETSTPSSFAAWASAFEASPTVSRTPRFAFDDDDDDVDDDDFLHSIIKTSALLKIHVFDNSDHLKLTLSGIRASHVREVATGELKVNIWKVWRGVQTDNHNEPNFMPQFTPQHHLKENIRTEVVL